MSKLRNSNFSQPDLSVSIDVDWRLCWLVTVHWCPRYLSGVGWLHWAGCGDGDQVTSLVASCARDITGPTGRGKGCARARQVCRIVESTVRLKYIGNFHFILDRICYTKRAAVVSLATSPLVDKTKFFNWHFIHSILSAFRAMLWEVYSKGFLGCLWLDGGCG